MNNATIEKNGNFIKLIANENYKISNKKQEFFCDFIFLPLDYDFDNNLMNYISVPYEMWGVFVEDEIPKNKVEELESQIKIIGEQIKEEEWEDFISSIPTSNLTLEEIKNKFILKSKENLSTYLENNPLYSNCHGGKYSYYTVTFEKQIQLTQKFTAHMVLTQAGIPDVITWNCTGGVCEEFTDEEIIQLIYEMNAYVTPLVSKQQHLEKDIVSCETKEELLEINIEF